AMFVTKMKQVALLVLTVGLLTGSAGWLTYHATAGAPQVAEQMAPVELPADPQAVVLLWDNRQPDLVRKSAEPRVRLLADGTLTVNDPYGPAKPVHAKLPAEDVQDLLRYVLREQGFFRLEGKAIQDQIRAEQMKRGRIANDRSLPTTLLRLLADGREHE